MKRFMFIGVLCIAACGCTTEIEKARPGQSTGNIHVLDAVTGKCVAISGFGDSFGMQVVEQAECRALPTEANR